MKDLILISIIALTFGGVSCKNKGTSATKPNVNKDTTIDKDKNMKSFISLFEIPATDISRAINFYQTILDIKIEKIEVPGMEMGIFPYDGQMVTGVIVNSEGYRPSVDGVTIYLNGGDNLQHILDKVDDNGGKIIIPKTSHADGNGFFALFTDTEGNKLGLNSPN
ncbi:hypothetical protein SAMN03080594_102347 [Arenibacter palladensis]|uniref:VOC domain-containing protein n=1 Tax=Arenibacter palladensis TaxID=237373 RepID=A0A1M4Y7R4_9FLAO|nr:VOC family protein [Arenibacter palladensis]SHF01709.1 hypothetical protein SAMN03080594_102347 [Arenibacter palladensis]